MSEQPAMTAAEATGLRRHLLAAITDAVPIESSADLIDGIVSKRGWLRSLPVIEGILRDNHSDAVCERFAGAFFSAALRDESLPWNRVIALLCLSDVDPGGNALNLILSIASEAKDVPYQSWSPDGDPEVQAELEKLRAGR